MPARHDKYYFDDRNAIFQVGDKLFGIHKRLLVASESSTFASMFSLPQTQNAEGQTDEKPIILTGDKLKEFEALMRILYPPLLDDIMDISINTYAQAMRVAVKYSMDNVQTAIVRVINSKQDTQTAIARVAFLAEFSDHFPKGALRRVFAQACQTSYRPSGHELVPLLAHPNLLALMMQFREGSIKPDQAIWNEKKPVFLSAPPRWRVPTIAPEDKWLDEQLESLGSA